ncbi:ABC transporter ATP-binding protein [Bradyrhizobium sp. SRL28]|uniref:ABC transporter ATP-binding protein n=1 Tax=Bradyrhizobium sp. SRL28 TaxID=2836178 RepID=UPI001BDF2CFD|nr:ABC transporter ATP-binding protein [Bradyrhizobium sp. SRL28]MBT1517367.1 ABC transporter ATP-binding protein [Bradyrhizobium sp. SRL28]
MPTPDLELIDVRKSFGGVQAVDNVSLSVQRGEFVSLLGPSGCGKTTLMRMVAGLLKPTSGDILIRGERVNDHAPYQRDISLMFQNYALFPHKTSFENVAFGLKYRGVGLAERQRRVREALKLMRLPDIQDRYPHQLSGGQQQRVALARSLVVNPAVLLLDEPLSNLDKQLRVGMQVELKQIQEASGVTFIFVTHDQGEALAMSDRIVVMNAGKVLQLGSPREVYNEPLSRFVADFLGQSNFFEGHIERTEGSQLEFKTDRGLSFVGIPHSETVSPNGRMTLQIRAERVKLSSSQPRPAANSFKATLERSIYEGTYLIHQLRLEDGCVLTSTEPAGRHLPSKAGSQVWVAIDPEDCRLLVD